MSEVLAASLYRGVVGGGCGVILSGALFNCVDAALHGCLASLRRFPDVLDLLGRLESADDLYEACSLHEVRGAAAGNQRIVVPDVIEPRLLVVPYVLADKTGGVEGDLGSGDGVLDVGPALEVINPGGVLYHAGQQVSRHYGRTLGSKYKCGIGEIADAVVAGEIVDVFWGVNHQAVEAFAIHGFKGLFDPYTIFFGGEGKVRVVLQRFTSRGWVA